MNLYVFWIIYYNYLKLKLDWSKNLVLEKRTQISKLKKKKQNNMFLMYK